MRWYTGRRFAEAVDKSGARFGAISETLDWDFSDLNSAFHDRAELKGIKQAMFDMVEILVRPLREHLPVLKALLIEEPAEVFVSHTAFYGDGWLHEMGGPPNATLGDTCLIYPSRDAAPWGMGLAPRSGLVGHLRNGALDTISWTTLLAPAATAAQEVRRDLGLPPVPKRGLRFGFFLSQNLHIQLCPAGFEYPRSAVADAVERVLDEPGFRERILALKGQIGSMNPAKKAADLLEVLQPRTGDPLSDCPSLLGGYELNSLRQPLAASAWEDLASADGGPDRRRVRQSAGATFVRTCMPAWMFVARSAAAAGLDIRTGMQ